MPDVSVIVPTRDRCRRLSRTLQSVLWQRGVEMEVIVVDDGSQDRTAEMLSGLADGRIRIVRNEIPLGESGARNRGIEEAEGTWIAFLDDDDFWAPEKLALQLDALRVAGCHWVYGGDVAVDEDLSILHGAPPPPPDQVLRDLVRYNSVPAGASNVVVHSAVLSQVGRFDPGLRRTADWDMWLRLAGIGPPAWVPSPLVANCVHPGNMSRDMAVMFTELPLIADRYGLTVDRARHYRWAAWNCLIDGQRKGAVRYYYRAIVAGDLGSIGRAILALAYPTYGVGRSSRSAHAAERDTWTSRAHAWLNVLSAQLERDAPLTGELPPVKP